ncbi:cyclase family protein [Pseudonocardiaceae bacterium YIM PH 21723]|nr:cyclase family protein [Pseudonocardiaceae bacterium YIM PH 21723]
MTEFRAVFDAIVHFANGGDLRVTGFRIDLPSPHVDEAEIGTLFLTSLGLLMTGSVRLSNVSIIEEAHKGTRGVPVARQSERRFVELNHVITDGMVTYPGLPGPEITVHQGREVEYAPGTSFAIDRLSMVGNSGTYLDSPYHRWADGADLAGIGLDRTVDLPAVVVRVAGAGSRAVGTGMLAALDVHGAAVLLHTGDSARFGTPEYAEDAHYLTEDGARLLADRGAALVGIDAVNIDAVADRTRPAHSILLRAGISIVEHLTGLDRIPATGARFSAVPLRISGFGTVPVRAYATV